jgi:hypothetical protein
MAASSARIDKSMVLHDIAMELIEAGARQHGRVSTNLPPPLDLVVNGVLGIRLPLEDEEEHPDFVRLLTILVHRYLSHGGDDKSLADKVIQGEKQLLAQRKAFLEVRLLYDEVTELLEGGSADDSILSAKVSSF